MKSSSSVIRLPSSDIGLPTTQKQKPLTNINNTKLPQDKPQAHGKHH